MNPQRKDFLGIASLIPARLNSQETAWFLGFSAHDIPILVLAGFLKPLGHPTPNAVKYFSSATLARLREDTQWLSRATDTISKYWKGKNSAKPIPREQDSRKVSAIARAIPNASDLGHEQGRDFSKLGK